MEIPADEKKYITLFDNFKQPGTVKWIGVRPVKGGDVLAIDGGMIGPGGFSNDHYSKTDGNRQVTLIQHEYIMAAASFLGKESIDPALLRRNIVVGGINLNSLVGRQIMLGEAVLEITGICHPCSKMEDRLGLGGYNAMRGHGGFNCKVIKSGMVRVGDKVI